VDQLIALRRNAQRFYAQPEESVDLFKSGRAALMFANYGSQQLKLLRNAGLDVGYAIVKEGALAWLDCWAITRSARHPRLAHAWIEYFLEREPGQALLDRQGLAHTMAVAPPARPGPTEVAGAGGGRGPAQPIVGAHSGWRPCQQSAGAESRHCHKLGLLLAGVIILSAGLTGFYAYQASRAMLVDSAKNDLLTTTKAVARRVPCTERRFPATCRCWPGTRRVQALRNPSSPHAQEQMLRCSVVMQTNAEYFQLRLIAADDNGIERVRSGPHGDVRLLHIQGDDLRKRPFPLRLRRPAPGSGAPICPASSSTTSVAHAGLGSRRPFWPHP
jgi:hypothetical protein